MHFPGACGLTQFSIQHWAEDRYLLHAGYVCERGASYTRFSLVRAFDKLPKCFVECVEAMRREFEISAARRSQRE